MKALGLTLLCSLLLWNISFSQLDSATLSNFECPQIDEDPDHTFLRTPDSSSSSPDWPGKYSVSSTYSPTDSYTPIKTVGLNFIIIQKDDGTGNFQQTNPNHVSLLNDLVGRVNNIYEDAVDVNPAQYATPCASHSQPDSRIRFMLNNIYYKQDSYGWNANYGPGGNGDPQNYELCLYFSGSHYLIDNHAEDIDQYINVFFVYHNNC